MRNRWNIWLRDGDFYIADNNPERFFSRNVTYTYITSSVLPVKTIKVCVSDHLYVVLGVSPFFNSEIYHLAKSTFTTVDGIGEEYLRFVEIRVDDLFMRQLDVFIRQRADVKAQFTPEIITEIRNILAFMANPDPAIRHFIPENSESLYSHLNPRRRTTMDLIGMIAVMENGVVAPESMRQVHKILASGDDPNKRDLRGMCPIRLVMQYSHPDYQLQLIQLIYVYGGLFDCPDPRDDLAPIEAAYVMGKPHLVNFFISTVTKPEKPVDPSTQLLTVDTLSAHNKILSSFRFPKGELYSTLKEISGLSMEEREGLYRLYRQRFEGDDAFGISFSSSEHKLVDIIRNEGGTIVGAVIYVIRFVRNEVWCNIDLELFDDACPNHGIMPAITYRLPFSLQALYPDKIIWIVFLGAHFSSFNRVKEELAVPRFREQGQVEEIAEILKSEFGYRLKLHHTEGAECYVVEEHPAVVKGMHQSRVPDLLEELYLRYRGMSQSVPPEELKKRDVLVALPVSFDFLKTVHNISARKGLNFYRLVCDLGNRMHECMRMAGSQSVAMPRFFNAAAIFWLRQKVQVNDYHYLQLVNYPVYKNNLTARK